MVRAILNVVAVLYCGAVLIDNGRYWTAAFMGSLVIAYVVAWLKGADE